MEQTNNRRSVKNRFTTADLSKVLQASEELTEQINRLDDYLRRLTNSSKS